MKEQYISPQMKLLSFAPAERLASRDVDFDELLGGISDAVISGNDDVDVGIDITLN